MKNRLGRKLLIPAVLTMLLFLSACQSDLGDKMANAGLNTLMGMGIVFLVLILISFIISLFKYVNNFEAWLEKKKNAKKGITEPVKTEEPEETEEIPAEEDDLELVAVIAAAIAAYEGTSSDGIQVRSIRKVSSAKQWKRG